MITAAPEAEPRRVSLDIPVDARMVAMVAVLLAQALWLGTIMLRGWYSGPDLANLGAASGQPLSQDYLTMSLGGHFGAPTRLLYWVLERTAPLSWGLTVAVRLVLQAAATYLLWRLVEELIGRRPWIPLLMALYAFSPLLVPGTAVLSSGIGLQVGQAAVLGALLLHVRYTRGGPSWQAVASALLVLLAVAFADQVIPVVVVALPLLSLGFLQSGSLRQRLVASAQRWVTWAALGVAGLVFGYLYLSGSYTGSPSSFTAGDAWAVVRTEWTQVLGPALLGGPWRWVSHPDEWSAYASPPVGLEVLGQLALLGLVVLSVRRTGRRALLALSLPVLVTLAGVLLVGYGRNDFLGTFVAPIYRYSFYTPMVLAVGIALAFAKTPEEGGSAAVRQPRHTSHGWALPVVAVVVGVASIVSGLGFADRFWQNPAHDYVNALVGSLRKAGPAAELYDTSVPNGVVPGLEPNHFVSDLLPLARETATFGGSAARPLLADSKGHLVPSTFYKVADITSPTLERCGAFVHGLGSTVVTLGPQPRPNGWYLELQLYQSRPNVVQLEVRDADGKRLAVAGGGATLQTSGTLVAVHRRLEVGVPATLTLTSSDPSTSLCLVHAYVGFPVVRPAP